MTQHFGWGGGGGGGLRYRELKTSWFVNLCCRLHLNTEEQEYRKQKNRMQENRKHHFSLYLLSLEKIEDGSEMSYTTLQTNRKGSRYRYS